MGILLLGQANLFADGQSPIGGQAAARADQIYREAKARFNSEPTNIVAAWKFASACFDCGENAANDAGRAKYAEEGMAAAKRAMTREPKLAAAHYYLAMNIAELARTKSLGALKLVEDMEREFSIAAELDQNFDFAGPDRNLGMLYLEAPGWPMSIGSRSKARQHLLRAAQLSPDYPENHLNLLEAYRKWGDTEGVQREAKKFQELLPEARKKFSGEEWQSSWADWEKRWQAALSKMSEKSRPQSPHSRK